MKLGEKISVLRKKSGLTIDELAALSNVPKGTLNKIISGDTKDPQLSTVRSIANSLGCSLDDLDEFVITKKPPPSEDESDTYRGLTYEAVVLASRYDDADTEHKNIARIALGLGLLESSTEESPKNAAELKTG